MTITEHEPTTASLELATEAPAANVMAPEIYRDLPNHILADGPMSGDHKVIGRIWILASLLFGLFAVVADILVRIERVDTDSIGLFSSRFVFEQWFTLQRVSLVFLFVVPLLIGLATVIVPLQIGAPSVAFPRAASAALWTWMVSGIMLVVSWAIDGGLVGRADDQEIPIRAATQLSMLALAMVVFALLIAAMVLVTTIFTERSQGMSLYNVPMFTWSMLVAGGVWLLSLPVLIANLVVMWFDARGEAWHSFGGQGQYDQISWVFDQPQVFAFAIPVLGVIAELIPVAVRRRLKNYDLAMVAIGAFGAFSFGAYAQRFFNPTANTTWLYVLGSLTILVPILLLLRSIGQTVSAAGRAPAMSAQVAVGVAAVLGLLAGGALAAVRVLDSVLSPILRAINFVVDAVRDSTGQEWQVPADPDAVFRNADGELIDPDTELRVDELTGALIDEDTGERLEAFNAAEWISDFEGWIGDTFSELPNTSVTGAMVQVIMISALLAAVAGLFHWAPKVLGHRLPGGAAGLIALSLLGGALLAGVSDAASGFMDQPDFLASGSTRNGVEALNTISLIGAFGVAAGVLVLLLTLGGSFFVTDDYDEDEDPHDPWGGHTLEWLTDSPPAPGNFSGPIVVTSEAPLLDDDFVRPAVELNAAEVSA